jgi:DNA mismatch endonuclease, patch repair protein
MSRVKSRGNKSTELKFIAILRRHKIVGWRRHPKMCGSPDVVFLDAKLAVFLDGCFWHGCPKCYREPKANKKYWVEKVARNKIRDAVDSATLRGAGWRVKRFWECELRDDNLIKSKLMKLLVNRS